MHALIDVCQAGSFSRGRLCACLEASSLGRLRASAGDVRCQAGDHIFHRHHVADAVYGLRQGMAILSLSLADGRRQIVSVLLPGDIFGFSAHSRHGADAMALIPSSLCRIPLTAMDDDPVLAARIRQAAGSVLADSHRHMARLGRMTADERVENFLADLWRRSGRPDSLHLPMTVAMIGEYLGLRGETVSRGFSRLRRQGIIGTFATDGLLPIFQGDTMGVDRAA